MSTFVPVSKSLHARSGWMKPEGYAFAASESLVPVLADELAEAMTMSPLAFREQTDPAGQVSYQLCALLSPVAGLNLLLRPDGVWLAGHVPVMFLGYPFRALTGGGGEQTVHFDQDSGLLVDAAMPGCNRFFDDAGEPAPAFREILTFLQQYELRRIQLQQMVDELAALKLIVPWPLTVRDDAGKEQAGAVKIFRIDREAFQKLPAEPLARLHGIGALFIAYAQMLSEPRIQNFSKLQKIYEAHRQKNAASTLQANLDSLFGTQSELLKFDHL